MIIYFTAAISLKNLYGENYIKIVESLQALGHKVIHEHITDVSLEKVFSMTDKEKVEYYKKVLKWIGKVDLIVAEVSFPSTLNIGHEVGLALEKGKPVLALYVHDKASPFFQGIRNEKFIYSEYSFTNLNGVLQNGLETIESISDARFNFYISPEINRYLDWVNQNKKLPRAVFLRNLLEKAMKTDKDFNG